jgi:hypothetical protein
MREKTMAIDTDINSSRLRAQREATPANGWQSAAVFGVGGRQTLPTVQPRNGSASNCSLVSTGSQTRGEPARMGFIIRKEGL